MKIEKMTDDFLKPVCNLLGIEYSEEQLEGLEIIMHKGNAIYIKKTERLTYDE